MVKHRYTTPLELAFYMRERFRNTRGRKAARMAVYFLSLTDARLRNVFEMNQTQVDALKLRMQTRVDKHTDLDAIGGE